MSQIGKPPCEEGVILGGTPAAPCAARQRRWTLVAAILGSSLAFIDGTVVNVALPAIQRALGAATSDAQWVMESYALFLASLLLVGGVLGDRFGRKRIFLLGTLVFTVASVGCALATAVAALIVWRAVQGIGAALLVPGSLALISATFPQNERGAAIGGADTNAPARTRTVADSDARTGTDTDREPRQRPAERTTGRALIRDEG